MTALHLADDTYLDVPPERIALAVGDPGRWARWWPDQTWETTRDRGPKGRQWSVAGPVRGTAEVWLEPWAEGAVLHFFLRVDPEEGLWNARRSAREWRRAALRWKQIVHAMKDELETRAAV